MGTAAVHVGEDTRASGDAAGPRCLVVMYHYVQDTHEPQPLRSAGIPGLTASQFEQQLDELSAVLEPIDWPRLFAGLQGRLPIPERSFLLTFDDGLVDHARTVAPILQRRGLRGVFFVPGEILASERLLCAHASHVLLSMLGDAAFGVELEQYLNERFQHRAWLADVDRGAAEELYHYESPPRARLKYLLNVQLPISVRRAALEALFVRHVGSPTRWARTWYLSWDDLAALQTGGHTIGGHGYAHEPYTRLTGGQMRTDARRCTQLLDQGLGCDLRPFSYPFGRYNTDAQAAVAQAGFVHAFTTESSWLQRSHSVLSLPRVDTINVSVELTQEQPACPAP